MFKKRVMAQTKWEDELDNNPRLELSESTVCGEKYRTVRPSLVDWYNVLDWHSMELWCNAQFGPTPNDGVWTPGARWYMNNSKFWFRNEADLSWFILRWS
jgi:hypothetical protein